MDTIQVIGSSIEGGCKPGAVREIAPISVKNGKVKARCYSSNVVKTFVAKEIEILNSLQNRPSEKWEASIVPYSDYEPIGSFIKDNKSELEELGWFGSHLRGIRVTG